MTKLLWKFESAVDRTQAWIYQPTSAVPYVPRHRSPLAPNQLEVAYLPRHSSGRVDAPSLRGVGM